MSDASPQPAADQVRVVDLSATERDAAADLQAKPKVVPAVRPYDPDAAREGTRGDLARSLLRLLTLTIGGMILFIGLGRMGGGRSRSPSSRRS